MIENPASVFVEFEPLGAVPETGQVGLSNYMTAAGSFPQTSR